jgi:uncharacterized protein
VDIKEASAMGRHWHEHNLSGLTPEEVRAYCAADPGYIAQLDDYGSTPLLAACLKGHVDIARVLLEAGADPNYIAPDGESPLKAAIPVNGEPFNRALFDLLFDAGANPNLGLEAPLHIAVARGNRDLVAYLVRRGADPNLDDVDGSPPSFWAGAYGGRPDVLMMHLLVKLGADVKRRDGVGKSIADYIGADAMREVLRSQDA